MIKQKNKLSNFALSSNFTTSARKQTGADSEENSVANHSMHSENRYINKQVGRVQANSR